MKRKTVLFVMFLVLLGGSLYATSTTSVAPSVMPAGLMGYLNALFNVNAGICDPVPGSGAGGG